MDARKEVLRLLKEQDAVRVRTNNHPVWKFPSGRIWIVPLTPSDHHSWQNNLADLKRILGIKPQPKTTVHVRKKYVKTVEQPLDLLALLPEREDRPLPQVSPDALERKWLEEQKEDPDKLYLIYGHLPVKKTRSVFRKCSKRTNKGRSVSPEVLQQAQALLRSQGEKAMHDYLTKAKGLK